MQIILDRWAALAGALVVLAVLLSLIEIVAHLGNFSKPYLQRYVIRILFMVPIYSLNAWIAMIMPATGLYLDSLREVYESYVIYSFMKYLLNFLKYDTNLQQYIDHKPGPSHIAPLCCLPPCVGGHRFLIRCKHGILQYVVIRPITSLIAFASQIFNFYGEGNYNPLSGYTYPVLLIINNISQVMAMYCLVIFYTGYHQELRPMKPLAKFFSIKLVVFFSFFQSVLISAVLEIEIVEQTMRQVFPELDDKVALGRKAQELLICFDMLIASIGHLYAFSYKPFTEPDDPTTNSYSSRYPITTRTRLNGTTNKGCCSALCSILDFSEDRSDIREYFNQIWTKTCQLITLDPALPAVVASSTHYLMDDEYSSDNWPSVEGLMPDQADFDTSGTLEQVQEIPSQLQMQPPIHINYQSTD